MSDEHQSTREKLASQIGTAPWSLLEVHAQSDNLILADKALSLLDVAVAVADNETAKVNDWIEKGLLAKPSLKQWTHFQGNHATRFQFIIVHPFVIGQLIDVDF